MMQWALPGGFVDSGENPYTTVRREFMEEAGNLADPRERDQFKEQVADLFRNGKRIFTGYIDDPRNTDNAWTETTAFHYHCPKELGTRLQLCAGDDAQSVKWIDVDSEGMQHEEYLKDLYGAHRALIERAVRRLQGEAAPDSTWGLSSWLRSLSLHEVVAEAIEEPLGVDPFIYAKSLEYNELSQKLVGETLKGELCKAICSGVKELRNQKAATGAKLSAKFTGERDTFQMEFASLEKFFNGLDALIGEPKHPFQDYMKREHCGMKDSEKAFMTSNGIEGATPTQEWEFVHAPVSGTGYPQRPGWVRSCQPLECFERKSEQRTSGRSLSSLEEVNDKLQRQNLTEMGLEELIGGRLYTGPMYEKYNAVLRFFSGKASYTSMDHVPFLQRRCAELHLESGTQERLAL